MTGRQGHQKSPIRDSVKSADTALRKVLALIGVSLVILFILPGFLSAQEDLLRISNEGANTEGVDLSGYEEEESVQVSGMEDEIAEPGEAIQLSGMGEESFELSPGVAVETGTVDLPGPSEQPGIIKPDYFELSAGEDEAGYALPPIEIPAFDEIYDLSPAQVESAIFSLRPTDPYYSEVVANAPSPDITLLGPIPTISEEGIEFTDVGADWIFHQKSAGLTELRGHVMIIYDTTIITCDEATLDEQGEIYRFFGEGRVFVDDSDFTLDCDELEIHDAEGEKMIYIYGQSTLVVYADEDAEPPGEDSGRRDRLMYALKQQDSTITFTNAEYDYENDIFDAHGGVRFEQTDKYAEGNEFHGENETEYMHFTGNCEFWQEDGQWLYEHRVIEDDEDPPSKSDRITRALMAVPTTITCDEAEGRGADGWLEMRSYDGNVVYFYQDDKHAECETFTVWYSRERGEDEEEVPEEEDTWERPRGYGEPRLASEYPSGYLPWLSEPWPFEEVSRTFEIEIPEPGEGSEPEGTEAEIIEEGQEEVEPGSEGADVEASEEDGEAEPEETEEEVITVDLEAITNSDIPGVTMDGLGPMAGAPVGSGEWTPPGSGEGAVEDLQPVPGSLSELPEEVEEVLTGELTPEEDIEGPRNEVIMRGNVFIRQENGDWLFDYDVVREEEEDEETIEQYRKWANGSCDYLHVWTRDEIVEATGTIFGEQDNQDLACDFLRYLGKLDMLYLRGSIILHREGKHQLMSNEAFMFLSTNVFEAFGQVQTTVTVDVEESRNGAQEGSEEEGTQ